MNSLPYYEQYLKQKGKCPVCGMEITSQEFCVINSPEGIRVIHRQCRRKFWIGGCYAQIEVIYENKQE